MADLPPWYLTKQQSLYTHKKVSQFKTFKPRPCGIYSSRRVEGCDSGFYPVLMLLLTQEGI